MICRCSSQWLAVTLSTALALPAPAFALRTAEVLQRQGGLEELQDGIQGRREPGAQPVASTAGLEESTLEEWVARDPRLKSPVVQALVSLIGTEGLAFPVFADDQTAMMMRLVPSGFPLVQLSDARVENEAIAVVLRRGTSVLIKGEAWNVRHVLEVFVLPKNSAVLHAIMGNQFITLGVDKGRHSDVLAPLTLEHHRIAWLSDTKLASELKALGVGDEEPAYFHGRYVEVGAKPGPVWTAPYTLRLPESWQGFVPVLARAQAPTPQALVAEPSSPAPADKLPIEWLSVRQFQHRYAAQLADLAKQVTAALPPGRRVGDGEALDWRRFTDVWLMEWAEVPPTRHTVHVYVQGSIPFEDRVTREIAQPLADRVLVDVEGLPYYRPELEQPAAVLLEGHAPETQAERLALVHYHAPEQLTARGIAALSWEEIQSLSPELIIVLVLHPGLLPRLDDLVAVTFQDRPGHWVTAIFV